MEADAKDVGRTALSAIFQTGLGGQIQTVDNAEVIQGTHFFVHIILDAIL